MKNKKNISLIMSMALLVVVYSCTEEEDKCEDTKLDKTIEVDYYSWGSAIFFNPQGDNITANFEGTQFIVEFYKKYCNGKESTHFEYSFHTLADGTLQKDGLGNISFTMNNQQDQIWMSAYAVIPGTELKVLIDGDKSVGHYFWQSGVIKAEINMIFQVDEDNNVFWDMGQGQFVLVN